MGYSEHAASVTAHDLLQVSDPEVKTAAERWAATGEQTNVCKGKFSCKSLMNGLGMTYPAALIFLDWYTENPVDALDALEHLGG